MTRVSVSFLADLVGGTVQGHRDLMVRGIADLCSAGPEDLCFVIEPKYAALAAATRAGVLLTQTPIATQAVQILVPNVRLAYARIALHFHPEPRATEHRIHPSASVDPDAELEAPVDVGARVVVERGARIGAGTVLMSGVVVGAGSRLGRDCILHRGVTICAGVVIGARVTLHAGAIVGADGFGYAHDGQSWLKFPQLGTVVLADDVDIGAGCTLDRGAIGATRIGRGTKIDNLVHVGHNTVIGEHCVIAGCCVFAGSVTIGNHVVVGGESSFNGHITVCDGARFGGRSGIMHDITEPGDYMGYPVMKKRRWLRTFRVFSELIELRDQVRALDPVRGALEERGEPSEPPS